MLGQEGGEEADTADGTHQGSVIISWKRGGSA